MSANKCPDQLLDEARQALDLLSKCAVLFGRGSQLDILKAKGLIDEVFKAAEAEAQAFENQTLFNFKG